MMEKNDLLIYYQHFIRKFPGVSLQQAEELLGDTCLRYFKKGDIVYSEGQAIKGCYFVHSGIVKIYNTGNEGKQQIIKFEKDGDLFGFRSLIRREPACTGVVCMTDLVLLYISAQALQALLLSSAPFTYQLMQITCKELGDSNSYLKDMAQKSVRARLAEALCMLIDDFGMDEENVLNITLTREELADLIGTATESVIRLLSEFKSMKLIATKGRRLRIISRDKIERMAL